MAVCNEIAQHLERAVSAADLVITRETAKAADVTNPTQIINEANERIAETNLIKTAILNVYDVV